MTDSQCARICIGLGLLCLAVLQVAHGVYRLASVEERRYHSQVARRLFAGIEKAQAPREQATPTTAPNQEAPIDGKV